MSKQSANFYGSCEMEAHLDASLKSVSSLSTSLNALKFVAGPHFKKIDEQIRSIGHIRRELQNMLLLTNERHQKNVCFLNNLYEPPEPSIDEDEKKENKLSYHHSKKSQKHCHPPQKIRFKEEMWVKSSYETSDSSCKSSKSSNDSVENSYESTVENSNEDSKRSCKSPKNSYASSVTSYESFKKGYEKTQNSYVNTEDSESTTTMHSANNSWYYEKKNKNKVVQMNHKKKDKK